MSLMVVGAKGSGTSARSSVSSRLASRTPSRSYLGTRRRALDTVRERGGGRGNTMKTFAADPLSEVENLIIGAERSLPESARESLLDFDKQVLPNEILDAINIDRLLEADLVLGLLGAAYLTARPGVLQAAFDKLVRTPISVASEKLTFRLKADDISLTNQIGMGGFGAVYKATPRTRSQLAQELVVKKVRLTEEYAREAGDVEIYMNRRVTRGAPNAAAQFLGTVDYGTEGSSTYQRWLVWKYDGEETLEDVIKARDFPLNMEERLFGDRLKNMDVEDKCQLIIKKLMYQLISCLSSLHSIGVCHRDVKPENILVTPSGALKMIDLGAGVVVAAAAATAAAAANDDDNNDDNDDDDDDNDDDDGASVDLRNGFNYYPNFTLLDPGYAAPETFVMPESTPSPPAEPLAVLLSPFLWLFNKPDRFDMYSAGIVMLQMLLPRMRTRSGLKEFNNAMSSQDYDLRKVKESGRGGL
eukprot:jgi/Bigna1/134507/aug1.25_g9215